MGCDRRGGGRESLASLCLAEQRRRVPAKAFLPLASLPLVERALRVVVVIPVSHVSYCVPKAPELQARCLVSQFPEEFPLLGGV